MLKEKEVIANESLMVSEPEKVVEDITNLYFNPSNILSHGLKINFIVALRNYGKTYGTKLFAIKRHLNHGEEFIYIKRHNGDLKNLDSFFNEFREVYPEHTFTVKGKYFYCDGVKCGQAIPLSMWQKMKSAVFNNTTVIIFDEFIKEKDLSYYLPNEVESFMNLLQTIVRGRENFWVFMLGNAVTMANPYFMYFKLFPKKGQEIYKRGEFLVNIPNAFDFKETQTTTAMGRIMKGTHYEQYALFNEWKEDNEAFIEKRTPQSKYVATFEIQGKCLGLWFDKHKNLLYLSSKHNPIHQHYIVTDKHAYEEGKTLVSQFKQNYHTLKLGMGFLKGQLRFDDIFVRERGYDLLKELKVQ